MQGRQERDFPTDPQELQEIRALHDGFPIKADESAIPLMNEHELGRVNAALEDIQQNPLGSKPAQDFMRELDLRELSPVGSLYALMYIRTVAVEKINRNATRYGAMSRREQFALFMAKERILFFQGELRLLQAGIPRDELTATRFMVEDAYQRRKL